jgi:alpha-tubulin suppressor-like RCC1 family protein
MSTIRRSVRVSMVGLIGAVAVLLGVLVGVSRPTPAFADPGGSVPAGRDAAEKLTAGGSHTCAVNDGGGVSCWGSNEYGQLGTGVVGGVDLVSPGPLVALPNPGRAKAVSAGLYHTCAVLIDGQVACWGRNGAGQLGIGATPLSTGVASLVVLPPPGRASAVALGDSSTCALLTDGKVTCWGSATDGALGNASLGDQILPPPPVVLPAPGTATAIAAGLGGDTCALLTDGTVACWGGGGSFGSPIIWPSPQSVIGLTGKVAGIASGSREICALLVSGSVQCWHFGSAPAAPVALPNPGTASAISSISDHTCVLLTNQRVSCWGANGSGQLGNGGTMDVLTPPAPLALSNVVAIATGRRHSCARLGSGAVSCWGDDTHGQIGNGIENGDQSVPSAPIALAPARSVSAGAFHTCAVLVSGTASCWGDNSFTKLGVGSTNANELSPLPVVGLANVTGVMAGYDTTCATSGVGTQSGTCWGDDGNGKLGNGAVTGTVAVPGAGVIAGERLSLANGGTHACAVSNPGLTPNRMWCWGYDISGQVGRGGTTRTDVTAPVPVAFPPATFPRSVDLGGQYSCALQTDGHVTCWGNDEDDQLGIGPGTSLVYAPPAPVALPAPGTATAVSAGDHHACALLIDGKVSCWGNNFAGQLGIGTASRSGVTPSNPVVLPSPGIAIAISAGGRHTCALLTDGKVTCWGEDSYGQLGNGIGDATVLSPPVPIVLPSPGTAVSLSAGRDHTCVVLTGGGVSCWGRDFSGQLGDGATYSAHQLVPSRAFVLPVSPIVVTTTTTTTSTPPTGTVSEFVSLVPVRLADTRGGAVTVDGQFQRGGRRAGGSVFSLSVGGRGGVPLDARAVALNVTVTEAGSAPGGYVSVFACDQVQPNVSTLNYGPGGTVANSLVIKPGADGKVCVYTFTDTHLIVDVTGYMPGTSSFVGVVPGRLMDSRSAASSVDGLGPAGRRAGGSTIELQVGGRGGVPVNAKAVALNVTVTEAGSASGGYVTVFPCGGAQPNVSTLNYSPGSTIANAIVATLSSTGKVCVFTFTDTHLIVDVNGFFPATSTYAPTGPSRLVDTRVGSSTVDGQSLGAGLRAAGSVLTFQVTGRAGVPANAKTAVLNVTSTGSSAAPGGYLTVFPCDEPQPNTSNLNYSPGQTVAANAITKLSASGTVCVFSFTATQLVIDINGTFN